MTKEYRLCTGSRCSFRDRCIISHAQLTRNSAFMAEIERQKETGKQNVTVIALEYSDHDGRCTHGVMQKVKQATEERELNV